MAPRFLVLDGVDGCGKSTQAELLAARLERETGARVHHLREPGSTPLGEELRGLLLSREQEMGPEVETLLFAAARRQMLDGLVAPALAAGESVVCERFHPSTFAYQAAGGGLDEERVLDLLEAWASHPRPDLELVLDLDPEAAAQRRGAGSDRIEDRSARFQARVAAGYRRYAERMAGSRPVAVVDATGAVEEVAQRVWGEVARVL